jgi:amino acid transporter
MYYGLTVPIPASELPTQSGNPPASFRRVFSLGHLILFGVTFVGPTAPFPMFGIVSGASKGHMALAYLIAMVVMMLTALSYGRMASAFPEAGSAYAYTGKALHPIAGIVVGWTILLDYVLMPLMSVIYLALTAGRFFPEIPHGVWLVFIACSITAMNLFGLEVTNKLNMVMTALMMTAVAYFVGAAAHALHAGVGAQTWFSTKPFYNSATFSVPSVMGATSIAAFSFLGFDGISTLAEDARNPTRDIGRATVLVCFLCGAMFILQAYLGQLAWPDYTSYPRVETAFLDVSGLVGGTRLLSAVSFVLVVAGIASAVTGQASASRLLLGMGRDRLLPPRIFAYIHPKYSTPTYGILAMGVVTLLGGFLFSFQLAAEAINFGALLGFMSVNLCVVNLYFVRRSVRGGPGLVRNLLLPVGGFFACLYVFANLSATAKCIGVAWCVFGLLYAAWRTRGFRRPLGDRTSESAPVVIRA